MPLKTGDEYIDSIEALNLEANVLGQPTSDLTGHGLIRPSLRAVAVTYDCAHDDDTRALFRAHSWLIDAEVNRFTHLHQSADDLVAKVLMQRYCGNCTAWVQREDLVVDGAMTDPKGDRGKRPSEQADPDLYLRVVERRPDGVVVRGAKFHQTGMLNSHEILVMPTLALRPGEEEWAVCFAVPTDAPGVRYVLGRQASDTRKLESNSLDVGNPTFGGQEVLTVFDDVFVPAERVFLDGEVDFSGPLVERFAAYHRQSYGGCKVGVGDVLIGATALIAEMNGVSRVSHVRDKLVEMIHLNETLFACGVACSARGQPTAAGNYLVDLLLANVCKLNVTRFPYELARLATDVAGGLLGTLPAARELDDPAVGPYVRKYLAAAEGWDAVDRMKVLRLIENLVAGAGAVAYLIESMHGAGSPMAQRIMIGRQGDVAGKVELVKRLLRIKG
jgi:4-hydroxybutyryl-CoA dehydratase/vinylacetyl-CoA-Delta-isomerase